MLSPSSTCIIHLSKAAFADLQCVDCKSRITIDFGFSFVLEISVGLFTLLQIKVAIACKTWSRITFKLAERCTLFWMAHLISLLSSNFMLSPHISMPPLPEQISNTSNNHTHSIPTPCLCPFFYGPIWIKQAHRRGSLILSFINFNTEKLAARAM